MKCPKCATETLAEFELEAVRVVRFSTRCGIWLEAQDLGQGLLSEDAKHVASLGRGGIQAQLDGKRGRCPRDGSQLLRIYSAVASSVIIDACGNCRGMWLDGGEFEKLFVARRR